MGTTTERLAFILSLNAEGAIKGFQDVGKTADRELNKADARLDRIGSNMTKVGTGMAASGLVAAVALSKLGSSAGDLNETLSKSNVIFGDAAGRVETFGNNAAKASGLSKQAAIDAAASFGTLFTNIGKTSDEAASMSMEMTSLAGDLASFSNSSPEEAVLALGAALRGEAEPIRRFGVLLDDATLKQRAMTLGIFDGTGSLSPAVRAQAAYAEILAQTTKQQGDFARTSDSLANQQRTLAADLENLKTGIGAGVVPAMQSMVSAANSAVGAFTSLSPEVQAGVGTFGAYASGGLVAAGALSALVGQGLKMRSVLTTVTGEGDNASRSLTGFGKVAVGLPIAGAVFGLYEMSKAMNQLRLDVRAFSEASDEQLLTAFSTLEDGRGKYEKFGFTIEEAFRQVAEGSLGTAKRIRDSMAEAGRSTEMYDRVIDEYTKRQAQAAADTQSTSKIVDEFGKTADGAAASTDGLGHSLDFAATAAASAEARVKALQSATFDLPNAQRKVADGWDSIDDAAKSAGGATRDVEQDMRRARDAAEGLADAEQSLADAQKALDDARKPASFQDAFHAENELKKALLGQQKAHLGVNEAEEKLRSLRSDGTATTRDVQNAEIAVEEARLAVYDADQQAIDAQTNLNDVRDQGKEGTEGVTAAEKALADAQKQVRSATEAVADAQKAATEQGGAHKDTTKAIADAYETQKRNIWDTVDAMIAQGKTQQEIDAFIDASGVKLDEYAKKYRLAKDDVDAFKQSLDLLAILSDPKRTSNAFGGNYTPPADIAQGAYNSAIGANRNASSSNAAEYRITVNALDPQAAANAVVDALKVYQNNNGSIPIRVTG